MQLCKSSIYGSLLFRKALVELFIEIYTDNCIGDYKFNSRAVGRAVGKAISRAVGRAVGRAVSRAIGRAISRAVGRAIVELFVEPL